MENNSIFGVSWEMVGGVVRHALTTVGGYVGLENYFGGDGVTALVGGVMVLVGFGWSLIAKKLTPTTPAV